MISFFNTHLKHPTIQQFFKEPKVTKVSETSCEFSNRVVDQFLASLAKAGITDLEPIKIRLAKDLEEHNKEETPLFAKDIEKVDGVE